ncbi:MAG: hypothetical protein D3907_09370 [Candidatus Electrothrix sp. AUS3]|nr:hypothetical protein [Candidatus Electrothrix gigas]
MNESKMRGVMISALLILEEEAGIGDVKEKLRKVEDWIYEDKEKLWACCGGSGVKLINVTECCGPIE